MSVFTENQNVLIERENVERIQETVEESYVVGEAFDHTVVHSDTYYAQYIANFTPNVRKRWIYRFFKRSFDLLVAAIMLILLSPVMLVLAIVIKCDSKGPVIFKQKRMGKNGKSFNCYKFRTMRTDSPRDCATFLLENPEQYITRVGRTLRRWSLDELPQLWCVLVGTMSIVGYRPLVLTEVKCNDMRSALGVFVLRPGITGYAQVLGRDDVYYKNKAVLDAEYVKRASIWFDIKLLFQTVVVVLIGDGNDAKKSSKSSSNAQ